MFRSFILLFAILSVLTLNAQVTTDPAFPVANKSVKIIFDATEGSAGLKDFSGDVYAHTGVITDKSTSDSDWKYVVAEWNSNIAKAKMTKTADNTYELDITPDILSYYSVASNEEVLKLAFVFRSSDGSKEGKATGGKDIFVPLSKEGLNLEITQPLENTILTVSENFTISANSSLEASLRLLIDDNLLTETTGTSISTSHSFVESGNYWIIAEATTDTTVIDSVRISVRPDVNNANKPDSYKKGINYTSNNSAALVLWAPLKEFVYVLGDFNNWEVSDEYLMKKDGDFFWLDISGLEEGVEYAYQYFIDGQIKIADPYTEKILDPWNDQYISDDTYPNLKPYPESKTEGIVSVLQTAQQEYNWQVTDFEMPEKEKMVIYELLIRDFTEDHTYASVTDRLDYLEDLNINVLELLPVNEFEGNSSWGYNPSFYFAPDKYYGPKNELKKLIDECHKRGIAVVIDMVLNHSYGQSPFVQMYMDNWTILPENPWYNIESPNPIFSWGYDFNHESEATEELVDSVNSFWMKEYKVDGFRFDFTKGFTNTPGDGSAYDMPRIQNLKRMADEIWKVNPDALVILEHLAGNSEEMALANYGMMLWGNMNHEYSEAAMGYSSNLNGSIYTNRGWEQANLVSYMESHDEERLTYKCLNFGNSSGNYSTKELPTAMDRLKLSSLFFLPLPGPKMIWQFGELGYDYSINTCEDGTTIHDDCRTSPKPIRWDYLDNADRVDLYNTMAALNELKQTHEEFSPDETEYNLGGSTKWYRLSKNNNHVLALGNFGVSSQSIEITFPETGKYYEFFNNDSTEITQTSTSFQLEAGEYRLYSTQRFKEAEVVTTVDDLETNQELIIYPNPAKDFIRIESDQQILSVEIYSVTGKLEITEQVEKTRVHIPLTSLRNGLHLLKVNLKGQTISKKIIVK